VLDWLAKDEVRYLIPPMVLLLILCVVLVVAQHRRHKGDVLRLRSDAGSGSDPRQRLVGITLNAIMLFSGFFIVLHLLNLLFLSYPRYQVDFATDDLVSSVILFLICIGLHLLNRKRSNLVRYLLVAVMTVYVLASTTPDYLFEQRGVITLAIPLVVAGALLSFPEMLLYLVVMLLIYAFLPPALLEDYTGDYFVIMMLFAVGTAASVTSSSLTRTIDRERTLRRIQESMLRTVSHEMRTPVVSLQGFWKALQLNRAEVDLGPLDRLVDSVELQTEYLHQLVERVVWYTSTHRDTLPPQQVDLARIARLTAEQMASTARESGIQLTTTGTDEPLYVQATDELQTLSVNLVDNAIKHSGGSVVAIIVERDAAGVPALTVRDDGRGLPAPEIMGQPWVHQDVATGRDLSRGYGLGLAIVQDICRRNDAELVVKNERPGLSISVRFPTKRSRFARLEHLWRAILPGQGRH